MRDITPKFKLSDDFRINDENMWSEPDRNTTMVLNDFEWKKWTIWDQIED